MAAPTERLHVVVHVLATEGQRTYVVHVHVIGAVRFQAPVTPDRAPFLHESTEARSSVVPGRSSCGSGTAVPEPPDYVHSPGGVTGSARGASRGWCRRHCAQAPHQMNHMEVAPLPEASHTDQVSLRLLPVPDLNRFLNTLRLAALWRDSADLRRPSFSRS